MTPKRRIIPVFVPHMGCPNDCVFCNQRRISGKTVPATAETVLSAVESAGDSPAELAFYGGSFTAVDTELQDELLGAASEFLLKNPENSIRISTRPDCISEEILKRLKLRGVTTIELGAQSMRDEVLRLSRRGHTAGDVVKASEIIKNAGVNLILQMMTGLPGDTSEYSLETARKIIGLRPDGVRIYPTVIVRDTALYDMWTRGEYREHTVGEAVEICAELLEMFRAAGIPVIRMGLNPTDELSNGVAAGGAYHPAFGELVYSRVYYNMAVSALSEVGAGCEIIICTAFGEESKMVGHKRCNIELLKDRFSLKTVKVSGTDIERGKIKVSIKG